MKRPLFLYQFVDHLFAVLAVGAIADVYPIGSSPRVLLPDELVKLAMRLDPFEPAFAFLDVAVNTKVSGLAAHVLAVRDTADGQIECETPEAGTDFDWMPHRLTERLQHLMHQRTQIDDVCLTGIVSDAFGRSRGTRGHFLQREIFADICRHNYKSSFDGSMSAFFVFLPFGLTVPSSDMMTGTHLAQSGANPHIKGRDDSAILVFLAMSLFIF